MRRDPIRILIACTGLILGACASGEAGGGAAAGSSTAAEAPRGVPAPAGTPLAKVTLGMSEVQVRETAGAPTGETTYVTGKAWNPFYFGPRHQTDYKYKGQGRVVFARNRWSGAATVIRVDYDPSEDGV